jgi:phenylacetate-CoA ligase
MAHARRGAESGRPAGRTRAGGIVPGDMTAAATRTHGAWLEALERWRHAPDRPATEQWWAPTLETCPADELAAIQSEKLRLAVAYMYKHSGLFRDRCDERGLQPADVRGVEDLPSLPITTRDHMGRDLADHPSWGRFTAIAGDDGWARAGGQLFQTSGTTAQPRPFRYTRRDLSLWSWLARRATYAMGVRPGDVAVICFGYGPHVSMWALHYAFQDLGVPIIGTGGLSTAARATLIARHRPSVLAATPSYALHLAETMRGAGVDPASCGMERLIVGGEPMPPATRARLARTWGADVHATYGCTEAAPACCGYTCDHGMHVMEDALILETVDPATLAPVPDGTPGLTVITNLSSEASPQIRFLAGDFATIDRGPCPCGRTHARLRDGVAGRADDMLLVRGLTLFPSAIEDVLRGIDGLGDAFELVLTRPAELDELTIVCEPVPGAAADHDALAARVRDAVRDSCELRASVELRAPGSLPRTEFKARRVRDLR